MLLEQTFSLRDWQLWAVMPDSRETVFSAFFASFVVFFFRLAQPGLRLASKPPEVKGFHRHHHHHQLMNEIMQQHTFRFYHSLAELYRAFL